jgi:hypothetical protein
MNESHSNFKYPTMEYISKIPNPPTYDSLENTSLLSSPQQGRQNDRHRGWKCGVIICTYSALTVFLINLILLLIAIAKEGIGTNRQQIICNGDCSRARPLNIGIHLTINALSTILLSASNYCIQCLSAPTKEDVDKAHGRKGWLEIGVPTLRNLGVSSLPLHLL